MGKSIRCKNMMYVQQVQYLPAKIADRDKLIAVIENELHPQRYAIILHDQDTNENGTPAAPGYHVMLCFENARSTRATAKRLGDKEQSIEQWNGDANNGFSYLLHRTAKARAEGKHQYDPSEVTANFDFAALMQNIEQKVDIKHYNAKNGVKFSVDELLNALYAGIMSKDEVERQMTGAQYGRYKRQIEDVWRKRLQNLADEWRKEMIAQGKSVTVIWLYGTAGTGKTSLARQIAARSGHYFMSGSSRDIFQQYAGEHVVILDELRPDTIEYQDLLRILDPFGLVDGIMAPSRYVDKALAADLIIITTPFSPMEFYRKKFPEKVNQTDSFAQLQRRISLPIHMQEQTIDLVTYDDTTDSFTVRSSRPNPYSQQARPAPKNSETELFEQILG